METTKVMRPRGQGRILQHREAGTWFIAFYWKGREVRESVARLLAKPPRQVTKQDAVRALRRRMKEVLGEKFKGPEAERLTVRELLDDYERHLELRGCDVPSYKARFKQLTGDFGHVRIVHLTTSLIERWTEEALAIPMAPGTVNLSLAIFKAALNYGRKCGRVAALPYIPLLRVQNARRGFFEPAQIEALIAALPDPLGDVVRFAYLTGWRRQEILGLQWSNIDLAGQVITLHDSKNGDGRTVPLYGALGELVERRRARRALSPWVFHRHGQPVRDFREAWLAACTATRLVGKLFHDLRRTAIRDLVRAGVPETVAMTISGHRSRATFDRYNISSEQDRAEALKRVEAYRAALPAPPEITDIRRALGA